MSEYQVNAEMTKLHAASGEVLPFLEIQAGTEGRTGTDTENQEAATLLSSLASKPVDGDRKKNSEHPSQPVALGSSIVLPQPHTAAQKKLKDYLGRYDLRFMTFLDRLKAGDLILGIEKEATQMTSQKESAYAIDFAKKARRDLGLPSMQDILRDDPSLAGASSPTSTPPRGSLSAHVSPLGSHRTQLGVTRRDMPKPSSTMNPANTGSYPPDHDKAPNQKKRPATSDFPAEQPRKRPHVNPLVAGPSHTP